MARPKTKSSLVVGILELVESLRSIESKLNILINTKSHPNPRKGPGRPPGSIAKKSIAKSDKRGPGRPPSNAKRKPGRPAGTKKNKAGRPAGSVKKKKGRGRPAGSKNKK